ncbi:class A beta-lactamase-related serine hydrolase [Lysinibacillus sp. OL1]|nr:serine hydrolase [Lysinibacillus fusiformis]TBV87236.1 class A beta-lactamase-related serine hydrolase [Lysinibacillus sp. OL1]
MQRKVKFYLQKVTVWQTLIYLIAQPHSETFTAVAIMQLEEKGLLNLDNPISQYFPDFPNGGSIQISHLLSKSFPS